MIYIFKRPHFKTKILSLKFFSKPRNNPPQNMTDFGRFMEVVLMPTAGIGAALVFLSVQHNAWTQLKRMCRLDFSIGTETATATASGGLAAQDEIKRESEYNLNKREHQDMEVRFASASGIYTNTTVATFEYDFSLMDEDDLVEAYFRESVSTSTAASASRPTSRRPMSSRPTSSRPMSSRPTSVNGLEMGASSASK
jgi:hypothetical protein